MEWPSANMAIARKSGYLREGGREEEREKEGRVTKVEKGEKTLIN